MFSEIGSALTKASDQLFDIGMNVWDNYNSRKAAKKQYNYQMAFWQANNDYNSPNSQMQRLEEAGLNPNLVYGNGAATHQATMATAPSVRYKASRSSKIMANHLVMSQLENMEAQNQNLHQQSKNLQHQEQVISEQARAERLRNDFFEQHGYYPPTGAAPFGSSFGINPTDFVGTNPVERKKVLAKPNDSRYPVIGRNVRPGTGKKVLWFPWQWDSWFPGW